MRDDRESDGSENLENTSTPVHSTRILRVDIIALSSRGALTCCLCRVIYTRKDNGQN